MNILPSLYSLQSKEGMHLYYSVKERFGRSLEDRDSFIKNTADKLSQSIAGYTHIIIPESSNSFIEEVVKATGISYTVIKKNSLEFITECLDTLNLQRKEKESHLERLSSMEGSFKVNKLKANQRRKYLGLIFEKKQVPDGSIIVDDSYFSGTTLQSIQSSTGCNNAISVFSK